MRMDSACIGHLSVYNIILTKQLNALTWLVRQGTACTLGKTNNLKVMNTSWGSKATDKEASFV